MPTFQYQAKDAVGALIAGEMMGATNEDVAMRLMSQGLIPISIELYQKSFSLQDIFDIILRKGHVSADDLILFFKQMGVLSKSGVPIIQSLQRLAETTTSDALREAIKRVVVDVTAGQTLTASFSSNKKAFPSIVTSIVDAGENSGRLDLAFDALSKYFALETETMRRIKAATRYPMIVMVSIVMAIVTINLMVIPAFSHMFQSFQTTLPLPTRMLMASSDFMRRYIGLIMAFLVAAVAAARSYIKTPKGAVAWGYLKLKVPIVGKIIQRIVLARFARTFAMVMQSGVPLIQGLKLSTNALQNGYMEAKIISMREQIERGESLSRCASNTGLFTPLVVQMLVVGEETGKVDEMLQHVAAFYEEEVDYDLSRLSTLLEPVILGVLGLMVGVLALGVFLPMWNMSSFAKH